MIEVRIGDVKVDAGDLDAVLCATEEAVDQYVVAVREENNPTIDEVFIEYKKMLTATFGVYVSLGALLVLRERCGLDDQALRAVREILGAATGAMYAPAAPVAPEENVIIVPGEESCAS